MRSIAVPDKHQVLEQAIRILLGLVFLVYSLDKIPHPDSFARAIANYRLLPETTVNLLAVVLPWIECVCALLLLSGQWVRSASFVVACLLIVFMIAVTISLFRGLDIDCGCFSAQSGRKIGLKLLGEDLLMLAMSVFLILRARDGIGWQAWLRMRDVHK